MAFRTNVGWVLAKGGFYLVTRAVAEHVDKLLREQHPSAMKILRSGSSRHLREIRCGERAQKVVCAIA